jgi:hypothetical protein
VGGVSFNSKPQAQAWLNQTGGLASDFVLLALDPCSFLAWAHVSAEGALKYAKLAKDANFESAQEAKVLTSFDYDLPIFRGKDSASGVSRDDRVVPGLPNYKAWENKKVLSGLRLELKRLIKDSGDTLENAIQSNLHGEAKDVASAMWADTETFLNSLVTWISEHYSQLSEQAGAKDGPEVWKLVCHCIRAIFKLMHEAQLPGRGPHALGDQYGSVFWGALQTHRVIQDSRPKVLKRIRVSATF